MLGPPHPVLGTLLHKVGLMHTEGGSQGTQKWKKTSEPHSPATSRANVESFP